MAFVLVAVAIAAAVGTAPFDRLTTIVDPAWTEILKGRNPQLFPSLWLDGWFGRLTVRVATLVIAARFAPPRVRRLFLLAIPIGVELLDMLVQSRRDTPLPCACCASCFASRASRPTSSSPIGFVRTAQAFANSGSPPATNKASGKTIAPTTRTSR